MYNTIISYFEVRIGNVFMYTDMYIISNSLIYNIMINGRNAICCLN